MADEKNSIGPAAGELTEQYRVIIPDQQGHVSVAYTLAFPDKVTKLFLVNAPGLKLDEHVVYGGFGDSLKSREDFYAVMDRGVVNRPAMPGPVVDFMIEQTNSRIDFINGLATAVKNGEDFDLKDRIGWVDVPTLILWGEADEVVKFNVAQACDERIPDSELVVVPDAGHSPQLEKPKEIGLAIKQFLDDEEVNL